jgi:hypothetical protein
MSTRYVPHKRRSLGTVPMKLCSVRSSSITQHLALGRDSVFPARTLSLGKQSHHHPASEVCESNMIGRLGGPN